MKLKWCVMGFLLLVLCASIQVRAQQSDTNAITSVNPGVGDPAAEFRLADAFGAKLKAEAEKGDPVAQYTLATVCFFGYKIPRDEAGAVEWWRKAADQGNISAQAILGFCYYNGRGVTRDYAEAVKWYRKAAERGNAEAQNELGSSYYNGEGVSQDFSEAFKWFMKSAGQGNALAEYNLGNFYQEGKGTTKDTATALTWWLKAANQGNAIAEYNVGACYANGDAVPKNYIEGYMWLSLSAAQSYDVARKYLPNVEMRMTPEQVGEAQRLAATFVPRKETPGSSSDNSISSDNPRFTGTGFFITDDGYLISNYHVVKDASKVRLLTGAGLIDAKVVQVDEANDLALLKADGKFSPLAISSSRSAQLGGTVATVGFSDIGLQGFAPKLAKGEIASLSGAGDDPRYFQISVPVQPGNSGGALVDARGNVIGIVSAKLDAGAALAASGALPENVNYAVKSSLLLSFLESVPDVDAKLKKPNTADEKFEDVVKSAQEAAVLVLVY
jgi:TPR repeat protein